MPYVDLPRRPTRHFKVYKGERLVLTIQDTPGQLFSVAGPPPTGAPHHPFLNAVAHDAHTEGEMATLAWSASDFDNLLDRLIDAGLNVASWNDSSVDPHPQPHRLYRGEQVVGALWFGAGQFSTLRHQPPHDVLVFEHGTVTAYADNEADAMLYALQKTSTFSGLGQLLRDATYTVTEVEPYHP